VRGWVGRLRALLRRSDADRQMSAELAFHLDMETEKNIRAGRSPAAARRAAVLAFGGVERFTEEVRDVRGIGWLDELRLDLRHAARGFRRAPGFTAAAVAALCLGIGANIAVFAVVYSVVLAPLPYAEPERLVQLWESHPTQDVERSRVSPGTFVDLRARSRELQGIALYGERPFLLTEGGETWESHAAAVSPVLFELLGIRPQIGRTFPPDDVPGPAAVSYDEMVISHGLWQRRFGGDTNIVGRTVRMDYRWSYTVVGVMPPGFAFPAGTEIWTPLSYGRTPSSMERQHRYYGAIGRLAAGRTLEQAADESAAIAAQLGAEHPASNAGWTVELERLDRSIVGNTRTTMLVVLALAGCVLLIACGNVATLAVGRATARRHETAVRVALGAGRHRLIRQWMTEGVLLATLGGAAGLLVGYWSYRLLLAIAPAGIPRLDEVAFGGPIVAFGLVVTCISAVMVGGAPALRARGNPLDAMRTRTGAAGPATARTRAWLLGTQVALTFVLTVAAALLLRSFERLRSTDLGFRRDDVLSVRLRVPGGRFTGANSWFQRMVYYDDLIADLGALAGIRSVAGTTNLPLTGEAGSGSLWRADAPGAHDRTPPASAGDQWKAVIQIVTPRYFETLGIPFLSGRAFDAGDRLREADLADLESPRPPGVAIINEVMAKRFWRGEDPLAKRLVLFDDRSFAVYRTIVGVVHDSRAEAVDAEPSPTVYLPFAQHPGRAMSLVLRSNQPPEQLVDVVTRRLRAFDAAINVASVRPLAEVVGDALSRPRFTLLLVSGFAALALVIASVGVFGIVGYLVTRRTQEIGIRVALGASPGNVLGLVLREGLRPVLLGLVAGCLVAMGVARAMRSLLYDLAPLDGISFVAAAAVLLAASLMAAVIPARRAAGVDPLYSLRSG
jgi:putative ABC transport system permease protein